MHRLAQFKLKKKPLHDSNRSTDQEPAVNQSENSLPVLELSLPDSKSFRASVILPDLSRRFTLLRRNGELLPIDNFCEHVRCVMDLPSPFETHLTLIGFRHELEAGHSTVEDENILIHQYRRQYLNETPYSLCSPTSPSDTDTAPLSSPSSKVTSKASNHLFSGSSAARDAAYIHKTLRMSNNQKKSETSQLSSPPGDGHADQPDSTSTLDVISENLCLSISLEEENTPQSSQVIQTNQAKSNVWENKTSSEFTPAQLKRLSLAVDWILGSQQTDQPKAANFSPQLDCQKDRPHRLTSPPHSVSTSLDAESRVHEELLRALPDESSPIALDASSPWSVCHQDNTNPSHDASPSINASAQDDDHFSQKPQRRNNSVPVPALSDDSSSVSFEADVELLPENSFETESSVFEFDQSDFNDVPQPAPVFNRDQPLPSLDWTYDDALFIQRTLCSSQSQFHLQPSGLDDVTYNDVLFIQSALCSPQSHQPHQPSGLKTEDQLERSFSASTSPSAVGSPNAVSSVISPRSSSLQHRLNLARNFAVDSGRNMTHVQQHTNILHSPGETSIGDPPSLSYQLLSPSVDSPFPMTPPARSSLVGQAYIPSPIDSSALMVLSDHTSPQEIHDPRPRGFSSRAGRTIPTTLFRDVEAQVVAANAALRQVSKTQSDGSAHAKKAHARKKSISTAQVGAPKLLSASAKLCELELESSGLERITSHPNLSKKSSSFKLRLRKKRPSESRSNHDNNDDILDVTCKHPDSSKLISVDESTPTASATSTASPQARDSMTASPIQTNRHHSADLPESHASWKHPHALTNRVRKFMGRQKKLVLNPPLTKHNAGPTSSIDSNDTSSDVALVSQMTTHLQNPEAPQALRPESDSPSAWPPSAPKSSRPSKTFNELGLSSSDTPSRDSDLDKHRDLNSLFVSVISPDPVNGQPRRSWAEIRSFPRPQSLKPLRQSHLESDDPAAHPHPPKESSHVDSMEAAVDQPQPQRNVSKHTQVVPSPGFETPESEPQSPHSDCASSILDLYGCDSQSTTASSPKRSSSASCYSNPYDLSRPISGLLPSNRIQHPQRRSKLLEVNEENVDFRNESQPSNMISRQRNSTQNELMVMVQQLQNSTRYSEFEPTRSSLIPTDDNSAASFIKHIVKGNPDGHSFKMMNGNSHEEYVDDDDEAEVWKQILKG